MASIQAFNFQNFSQILSWWSALLKKKMLEEDKSLVLQASSPFSPDSWTWTTVDELTGEVQVHTTQNPGATYGNSVLKAFKTTSANIKHALKTLFINYDDEEIMWQDDLNFNLINSYASASQSFQKYNPDTEEFLDMPEFWFTRGCWYDMLPMCTKGKYLMVWDANVQSKAAFAIEACRKAYQKYVYTYTVTTESDGGMTTSYTCTEEYSPTGNTMGFTCSFWTEYLPTLKAEMDKQLEPIWKVGQETNYPEQNASSADLAYVTQLASDITGTGSTSITTSKKLSSKCGTFSSKSAGLSLG